MENPNEKTKTPSEQAVDPASHCSAGAPSRERISAAWQWLKDIALREGGNAAVAIQACTEVCEALAPFAAAADNADSSALGEQVAGQHYKGLAIQPAVYCQLNRLPYCESSVIRYVTRHRDKNGREDIEKAIHCLRLLLEIEYSEPNDQGMARAALPSPTCSMAELPTNTDNKMDYLKKTQEILADQLGLDEADITQEKNLITDLGCDSLDTVEIIMAFEEDLDIEVYDEDAEKCRTVADILALLEKIRPSNDQCPPTH